jgi:hypothetical protein
VFFLFVEKVGCTFLKHVLISEMLGSISEIDPSYYFKGWQKHNLIHTVAHEVLRVDGREVLARPDARIITFCRNPYGRFVSAYRDKIVNLPELEADHLLWVRREILFRKIRMAKGLRRLSASDYTVSIRDFADYVSRTSSADRDKHWAEQHLLNLADVIAPAEVIKLEDFDKRLGDVWKTFIGTTLEPTSDYERNHTRLPHRLLDEETANMIYDIYCRDFE